MSHVRQVIKWHNGAPEGAHRAAGLRAFLAKPAVAIKCDGRKKEIDRDLYRLSDREIC